MYKHALSKTVDEFQFYDSPIKSGGFLWDRGFLHSFNSMIVRLKEIEGDMGSVKRERFNSMIVRLKG